MANQARRTTDSGTVVLHLVLVTSFLFLVFTGLRIATDDTSSMWLAVLDPVLPMEHIWFRHLVAALIFTATLLGYVIYLIRARLTARVRLDGARLSAMRRPGAARWSACNTLVYWGLMVCFAIEVVTGTMIFFGADHLYLHIHLWTLWACLILVTLHIGLHAAVGGLSQLTRIIKPAPLVIAPPPPDFAELLAEQLRLREDMTLRKSTAAAPAQAKQRPARSQTLNAHPAATAFAAAMAFSAGVAGLEQTTRPSLKIVEINPAEAPSLDGDLSDPVWTKAAPATVMTAQGGDFGGSGQSLVEVRAVHDGIFAYFAFTWTDPTRSLKHLPLVKTPSGWQLAANTSPDSEGGHFHEDKFSLLLARSTLPLIGAAIHLSVAPRKDRPPSGTGRGMHYTPDGSIADVWVWRASHGGTKGHVDNAHFGAAAVPTTGALEGRDRYLGGFALDPGAQAYRANLTPGPARPAAGAIQPLRLPRDTAASSRALGRVTGTTHQSESGGARWWTTEAETIPYSKSADDKIPTGTVIPGILMGDNEDSAPHTIRGTAQWAAGRWTLEVARRLYTGSTYDVPLKTGTLMWLAAFDHSQSRHTRHLRPLRLEVD